MEHLRDRNRSTAGDAITSSTTVEKTVAAWLLKIARADKKAATKAAYSRAAEKYVVPALGGVRLGEVTVEVADRFLVAVGKAHGPGAARHARVVLSGALAVAARYGAISNNPVRDTEPITSRVKLAKALDDVALVAVVEALRADERAVELDVVELVEFLAGTGTRIGETLGVRFTDVDRDAGTVEINGTVGYIQGIGVTRQDRPKSAAGHRAIALPEELAAMVERRSQRVWPHNDLGLIFPNLLGRPRDPSAVRAELRRVTRAAGIADITPHTFRRIVATRLDRAGLSARQVADHLGHSQVSMTTDKYMGRKTALPAAAALLGLPDNQG